MDFFKLILLVGVVQGVFLSLGLVVKTYGKPQRNNYFLILIFLIALALLSKLLYTPAAYQQMPQLWYLADTVAYLIGPLWYFTILKSIQPKLQLYRLDWFLLAPILYHLCFVAYLCTQPAAYVLAMERTPAILYVFYFFCVTVLVVNGGYLWRAKGLLERYRDAQFPDLLLKGQYAFLAILGVWLATFILSFLWAPAGSVNLAAYNYAFVSLALLSFAMAFLALVRPASFYFLTQTYNSSETFLLQETAEVIEQFMREQQPYLQAGYTLQQLSEGIGVNQVLTSKAINRILQTNFNELINQYRVQHFIQVARQNRFPNLTLWGIAQEVGFGNKVTFYRAFKKQTGSTPKSYLLALEKGG